MHLYIHEFKDINDAKVKEVRELLFKNVVTDYQQRTGRKVETLNVSLGEHGKPYFTTAINMHFSISHSGRYWACMLDSQNVGLDIEDMSRRNLTAKRLQDIAKRFFTEDEQILVIGVQAELNELNDLNDSEESILNEELLDNKTKNKFFRIWTAKEAYMKFTGNGFSEGFDKFSVLDDSLDVYFRNVPVDPEVVLTFCSERDTNLDELINI